MGTDERAQNLFRRIGVPTNRPVPSDRLLLLRERDENVEGSLAYQIHQLALQLSEAGELKQAAETRAVAAERRIRDLEIERDGLKSFAERYAEEAKTAERKLDSTLACLDGLEGALAKSANRRKAAEAERDALEGPLREMVEWFEKHDGKAWDFGEFLFVKRARAALAASVSKEEGGK